MIPYIINPPPKPRRAPRLIAAHLIVISLLFSWSCLIGWGIVEFFGWLIP